MFRNEEKIKSFLSDLGRPTLRGVKPCPKCRTYNGIRRNSCKNKKCDAVFKDCVEKRKLGSEACKLVTGTSTQVYSVRVRDRGPDYRGFVQLPLFQGKSIIDGTEEYVLTESALCFVDSCQSSFDTSILKCHEVEQNFTMSTCQHIEAALKCVNKAQTLNVTFSILSSLNVNNNIKQELWTLATESAGPLVQRVSKNIMVVKCKVSPKHPLGYLHFSFSIAKPKDKTEHKYYCSCAEFKGQNKISKDDMSPIHRKCVHFYACIIAFASDPKLAEEFEYYISMEKPYSDPVNETNEQPLFEVEENLVSSILDGSFCDPQDMCDVEIQVLSDEKLLDMPSVAIPGLEVINSDVEVHDIEINANGEVTIIQGLKDSLPLTDLTENLSSLTGSIDIGPSFETVPLKKPKQENKSNPAKIIKHKPKKLQAVNFQIRHPIIHETGLVKPSVKPKKVQKVPIQNQEPTVPIENETRLSFTQWLASVTERINLTMHYQFNGKPDPLIFHIPQIFFDCLRERISYGGSKKRLPNFTNSFITKDSIPVGTFTKYSWHITNILHLKQIFETPLVSLQITRSFVQNQDGTYQPYIPQGDENEMYRKGGVIPIKPLELKTYLKVGNTSYDQVEPTPFIIEWIPDVLPVSKVGELIIKFEYGHYRNYMREKLKKIAVVNKSVSHNV